MGETHKKCAPIFDKTAKESENSSLNVQLTTCLYRFMSGLQQNAGQNRRFCAETKKFPVFRRYAAENGERSVAKKALLEQQLRDLDGVGGSALADLVAAAPEVQTALVGQVLTNAADIDDVLIGRVERMG